MSRFIGEIQLAAALKTSGSFRSASGCSISSSAVRAALNSSSLELPASAVLNVYRSLR